MSSSVPAAASPAVDDLLDACARVEEGQRVLLVAAVDGLVGGSNLVDEPVLSWLFSGLRARGARPSLLWLDLPSRDDFWEVPSVLEAALDGVDMVISHAFELPFEELLDLRAALISRGVPMVRNMATTVGLMTSDWAGTPYELVSEIRVAIGASFAEGSSWSVDHANGTSLRGVIGAPEAPFTSYAQRRKADVYRPFPEGVSIPVKVRDVEGEIVFDRTLPWWGRYVPVPSKFEQPVVVEVRGSAVQSFSGGNEARLLEEFYARKAERFGDAVYEVAAIHGGAHPCASVPADVCPDENYREFIEHHHMSSLHLHLGSFPESDDYPYMLHLTTELRGARLVVGGHVVTEAGTPRALGDPAVQEVAARHVGRPGVELVQGVGGDRQR